MHRSTNSLCSCAVAEQPGPGSPTLHTTHLLHLWLTDDSLTGGLRHLRSPQSRCFCVPSETVQGLLQHCAAVATLVEHVVIQRHRNSPHTLPTLHPAHTPPRPPLPTPRTQTAAMMSTAVSGRRPRPTCGPRVQAQRAGNVPNDSQALFPNIWEWKKPGYVNACTDFVASLSPEDRAGVDFSNNAGFFEAGSAPRLLHMLRVHACMHVPPTATQTTPTLPCVESGRVDPEVAHCALSALRSRVPDLGADCCPRCAACRHA